MREVCRWSLWLYKNLVQFLRKKILCFLLHYSWFKIWVLLYVICSSNFIFRSGLSRRCSVRIFLRSLILAHSSCCPRFGFCLVSPCRSEPVQVFFCLKLIFLLWFLREYCYRPVFCCPLISLEHSTLVSFFSVLAQAQVAGWLGVCADLCSLNDFSCCRRSLAGLHSRWGALLLCERLSGRANLFFVSCFHRAAQWPALIPAQLQWPAQGPSSVAAGQGESWFQLPSLRAVVSVWKFERTKTSEVSECVAFYKSWKYSMKFRKIQPKCIWWTKGIWIFWKHENRPIIRPNK
jgi:hypothetical protein